MAWRNSYPAFLEVVATYLSPPAQLSEEFSRFAPNVKTQRKLEFEALDTEPQFLLTPDKLVSHLPEASVSSTALQDALQAWKESQYAYHESTQRSRHRHGDATQLFDGAVALLPDCRLWSLASGALQQV